MTTSTEDIREDEDIDLLTSYRGGSLSELSFFHTKHQSKVSKPQTGGGTKGRGHGLSRNSRLTFLREHAKINADKVLDEGAILITLTFPEDKWTGDDSEFWRNSREKFKRRLDRSDERYGQQTLGSWRLELGDKDSPHHLHPHYHCLLFSGLAARPIEKTREWAARSWWESCGRLSENHFRAGTSVERLRFQEDWSKLTKYIGKAEAYENPPITGRACGWWGKKEIKERFIDPVSVRLDREEAIAVREWLAGTSGYELPPYLYDMKTFIPFEEVALLDIGDEISPS